MQIARWAKVKVPALLVISAILAGLYLVSQTNYLLFHSLAEFFSILVAYGLFVVAWKGRRFLENGYLLFIGIAHLFVASLDLVHTLAFKGMGVFPAYDTNLPTQLWIAARYLQSLSLLAAPLYLYRPIRPGLIAAVYTAVVALVLLSIFSWGIFPDSYIEGIGLTPFKQISEYVISLILAFAMILLVRHKSEFDGSVLRLLLLSITAAIVSELAFTNYINVYGSANAIGHLLKILSFYLIFAAIIGKAFDDPYDLLFRKLKQSEADTLLYAQQLERTNQDLKDFAFIASHDLQEPLRKIKMFSDRVREKASSNLDEESADYLARMSSAAERMQAMVDGLLTYSRVTTQAQPFSHVDLSKVVQEVISDLVVSIEQSQGEVEVGPLPAIEADIVQMRQLLQNLIGNALKFIQPGQTPRVQVTGEVIQGGNGRGGRNVQLRVSDNGIGFDEKNLDRLFIPFQRLVGRSEYEGSGIGLALCRRIVERHNGSITAQSTPGKGTTFIVTLPATQTKI